MATNKRIRFFESFSTALPKFRKKKQHKTSRVPYGHVNASTSVSLLVLSSYCCCCNRMTSLVYPSHGTASIRQQQSKLLSSTHTGQREDEIFVLSALLFFYHRLYDFLRASGCLLVILLQMKHTQK